MTTTETDTGPMGFAKTLFRPLVRRVRAFMRARLPALYRDGTRYDPIAAEIRRRKPRVIVEIGTCRGENAERMLRLALRYGPVDYHGFDLFEEMDGDTLDREAALWPATRAGVESRLKAVRAKGRSPRVHLHQGDTAVILLRVFSGLAGRFPDWNLTILGDGPDRAALEAQRESLGLGGRVALPGNFKLPHDIIRQGDLFVVSSRYEGFSLALAEALGCGLPAVSFDCPSGPSLLLRHGVDGLLVPNGDERALAEALADLMRDGGRRARMAERAPEVLERFSEANYIDRWEELIADIFPRGPERE